MRGDADAAGRKRELFTLKTEVMCLLRGFHPPRPSLSAEQIRVLADGLPQPRPFAFEAHRLARRRRAR